MPWASNDRGIARRWRSGRERRSSRSRRWPRHPRDRRAPSHRPSPMRYSSQPPVASRCKYPGTGLQPVPRIVQAAGYATVSMYRFSSSGIGTKRNCKAPNRPKLTGRPSSSRSNSEFAVLVADLTRKIAHTTAHGRDDLGTVWHRRTPPRPRPEHPGPSRSRTPSRVAPGHSDGYRRRRGASTFPLLGRSPGRDDLA